MSEFSFRRSGSKGCEILTPDGTVVAWAVDESTAAIIVGLLNWAERTGLGRVLME